MVYSSIGCEGVQLGDERGVDQFRTAGYTLVNRFRRYHPRFSLVKYFSKPTQQFLTMQGVVIGLDITPKFSYVTPVFTHDLLDLFAFRA
jgi:hypothetical protein